MVSNSQFEEGYVGWIPNNIISATPRSKYDSIFSTASKYVASTNVSQGITIITSEASMFFSLIRNSEAIAIAGNVSCLWGSVTIFISLSNCESIISFWISEVAIVRSAPKLDSFIDERFAATSTLCRH